MTGWADVFVKLVALCTNWLVGPVGLSFLFCNLSPICVCYRTPCSIGLGNSSSGTRVVVQCFGLPSYDWFFYFLFLFLLLYVSELVIHNGSAPFLIFLP